MFDVIGQRKARTLFQIVRTPDKLFKISRGNSK